MDDKKSLRQQLKEKLSQLSKPLYEDYSYKIAKQLYNDEDWKNANVIGITISKYPEVDTYQIIRKAWELGKKIVVPKCDPADKTMAFRMLSEFSQLECVFYGLYEPIEELTRKMEPGEIDLLIVPGLAYTEEGFRIGFGGGYYDRYLKDFSGQTVSLAFHTQMIPSFTVEKHDMPISKIITNERVIRAK